MSHATTLLTDALGDIYPIDTGLVRIISWLWARRSRTVKCCEGSGEIDAYIEFLSRPDASWLLDRLHGGVIVQVTYASDHTVKVQWRRRWTEAIEVAIGARA